MCHCQNLSVKRIASGAADMTVLGCKICKDKAEQFRVACKRNGTTPNAVFMVAIEKFLEECEPEIV